MMPDRSTFENAYADQAPWDIGRPQKPFIAVADRITGSVLDAGCGTGDTALLFAGRGCHVTGIDPQAACLRIDRRPPEPVRRSPAARPRRDMEVDVEVLDVNDDGGGRLALV